MQRGSEIQGGCLGVRTEHGRFFSTAVRLEGVSKSKPEIYVSTDVEADGPIPGPHSMLSLGSAAYLADKTLVDTYSVNLELLPGAEGDPRTMRWWRRQPEAWAACRQNTRPPEEAMPEYDAWVRRLPGKPVFVAYPAGFDFTFVYWYLMRFVGRSAFSYSALDIKTFAMATLGSRYRQTTKRNMPRAWFDDLPHTHVALDDAIEQGALFCNMLADSRGSNG
ncbi:MAG: exonuclease [Acidobacteriota bacterium]